MRAAEIVLGTGAAAFSRAPDGTITAWNEAAEMLMSIPAEEVIGRHCHEVIKGRDVFGNDFCGECCSSWRMAVADQCINPYQLVVTSAGGRSFGLRVSILQVQGSIGPVLVHVLEPVTRSGAGVVANGEINDGGSPPGPTRSGLTPRELEVLRHLAQGYGTTKTARRMKISTTTVRNHISRCLQKLDAHSRIEAVAIGRRLDLV